MIQTCGFPYFSVSLTTIPHWKYLCNLKLLNSSKGLSLAAINNKLVQTHSDWDTESNGNSKKSFATANSQKQSEAP